MKLPHQAFARALGVAGLWLAVSSAHAVAPRAYVSVTGNDGNTCSNPATPCRTFVGAIAQVTSGGEVVVLDSGTFGGGTITQAVTINAPQGVVALVATPLTINVGSSDIVALRGISFVSPVTGTGIALTFNGGGGLKLENCVFHGWQSGINFAASGRLSVADTTVRESSDTGLLLNAPAGAVHAEIVRTRLLDNANFGLWVISNATATIKDSVASGNGVGLYADPLGVGTADLTIESCVLTNNTVGAFATSGGTIRISTSTLTDNSLAGLDQDGAGVVLSRGNSTFGKNASDTVGTIGVLAAK